jgi:hypothetical protein
MRPRRHTRGALVPKTLHENWPSSSSSFLFRCRFLHWTFASGGTGHMTHLTEAFDVRRFAKGKGKTEMKKVALVGCLLLPLLSAGARTPARRPPDTPIVRGQSLGKPVEKAGDPPVITRNRLSPRPDGTPIIRDSANQPTARPEQNRPPIIRDSKPIPQPRQNQPPTVRD